MDAKEFTAKRRKEVALPDGSEFVIRRIGVMDVLVAGGNADLSVFSNGKSRAEHLKTFAEKATQTFERIKKDAKAQRDFCEAIIMRGVVAPNLSPQPPLPRQVGASLKVYPPSAERGGAEGGGEVDAINIADLSFEECVMLAGAILKFSGLTGEAAKQLDPLSATGSSLKASTPSQNATEDSPGNSSSAEASSNPTPSTSHPPAPDSTVSEGKPNA